MAASVRCSVKREWHEIVEVERTGRRLVAQRQDGHGGRAVAQHATEADAALRPAVYLHEDGARRLLCAPGSGQPAGSSQPSVQSASLTPNCETSATSCGSDVEESVGSSSRQVLHGAALPQHQYGHRLIAQLPGWDRTHPAIMGWYERQARSRCFGWRHSCCYPIRGRVPVVSVAVAGVSIHEHRTALQRRSEQRS